MVIDILEIIVAYMQYLVLLMRVEGVNLPASWVSTAHAASIIDIDAGWFAKYSPTLPIDFRVYFLIVSVLLPLAVIFFGLFALNTKLVVVWYFTLLCGIAMLLAGVLGTIFATATPYTLANSTIEGLLLAGGIIIIVCTIACRYVDINVRRPIVCTIVREFGTVYYTCVSSGIHTFGSSSALSTC